MINPLKSLLPFGFHNRSELDDLSALIESEGGDIEEIEADLQIEGLDFEDTE